MIRSFNEPQRSNIWGAEIISFTSMPYDALVSSPQVRLANPAKTYEGRPLYPKTR